MNTDVFQRIPHQSFETYARYRKAENLATALIEAGIPPEAVPDLTDEQRHRIETAADVRIASTITWGIAVLILTQRDPHAHPAEHRPAPPPPTIADIHKAIAPHTRKPKLF